MAQIKILSGELVDSSTLGIILKANYDFPCDERLAKNQFIIDLKLCRVYLNDNKNFPWLILVPRLSIMVQNAIGLDATQCIELYKEKRIITQALVNEFPETRQLNAAEFSNIVPQFHLHLIARNISDLDWPKSVFDSPNKAVNYTNDEKNIMSIRIKKVLSTL